MMARSCFKCISTLLFIFIRTVVAGPGILPRLPTKTHAAVGRVQVRYPVVTQTSLSVEGFHIRKRKSICGYSALNGTEITCPQGAECLEDDSQGPRHAWCSYSLNIPVTTVYDYGSWPDGGCEHGQLCCDSQFPSGSKWLYHGGKKVQYVCARSKFVEHAFEDYYTPSPSYNPSAGLYRLSTSQWGAWSHKPNNTTAQSPSYTSASGNSSDHGSDFGGLKKSGIIAIALGVPSAILACIAIVTCSTRGARNTLM